MGVEKMYLSTITLIKNIVKTILLKKVKKNPVILAICFYECLTYEKLSEEYLYIWHHCIRAPMKQHYLFEFFLYVNLSLHAMCLLNLEYIIKIRTLSCNVFILQIVCKHWVAFSVICLKHFLSKNGFLWLLTITPYQRRTAKHLQLTNCKQKMGEQSTLFLIVLDTLIQWFTYKLLTLRNNFPVDDVFNFFN